MPTCAACQRHTWMSEPRLTRLRKNAQRRASTAVNRCALHGHVSHVGPTEQSHDASDSRKTRSDLRVSSAPPTGLEPVNRVFLVVVVDLRVVGLTCCHAPQYTCMTRKST